MPDNRPPKAFYDWLEANYGWTESTDWKYRHMWGEGYLDDPVYLFWEQNTPEGRNIAIIRKAKTKAEGAGEIDPYTLQLELSRATTREELADIWDKYVAQGVITGENTSQYQDMFEKALKAAGVGAEISPLVRREKQFELSKALKAVLDSPFVPDEEKVLVTGDEGKRLQEAYLSGESNDIIETLAGMYQRAQTREAGPAQRAETALASMQAFRKPRPPEAEWQRPPMPSAVPVAKAFLEETGLGKGTKLRGFLEREFIPEVAGETRAAREKWWARMHPEPVTGGPRMTGEEEIGTLREEARRWANIAWGGPEAFGEEVLGGTYYGEGGLKGMAERSYRTIMERLGEKISAQSIAGAPRVAAGGFGYEVGEPGMPPPPEPGEDPLIAALRAKRFRPEYYRKPGAGLVSRLTPAIRF